MYCNNVKNNCLENSNNSKLKNELFDIYDLNGNKLDKDNVLYKVRKK